MPVCRSNQDRVADTSAFLRKAIKEGKNVLFEGQLGALKDTDHGIYPYVTSSSTLAGYASVGAGVPPYAIDNIVAITKAYSSAVGEGPFVSELFGEEADELRRKGGDKGEFGATTGRPRRVGYFDAVATRYGCEVQGATEVCMTCLDVLSYMDTLHICTGYEYEGKVIQISLLLIRSIRLSLCMKLSQVGSVTLEVLRTTMNSLRKLRLTLSLLKTAWCKDFYGK